MRFGRFITLGVAAIASMDLSLAALHAGQSASDASGRRFEVASVRATTDLTSGSFVNTETRFARRNIRLKALIAFGFGIDEPRLIGNQGLLEKRFDVSATMVPPASPQDVRVMVRNLLIDRFAVRTHEELREQPVYYLLRVSERTLGPRLQAVRMDCAAKDVPCRSTTGGPWLIMETGREWTALALAQRLSGHVGRVVVDKTGLVGQYNIRLEWNSSLEAVQPKEDSSGQQTSLFTALREQLGLKLEAGSARVPQLVIDDVREPTEN